MATIWQPAAATLIAATTDTNNVVKHGSRINFWWRMETGGWQEEEDGSLDVGVRAMMGNHHVSGCSHCHQTKTRKAQSVPGQASRAGGTDRKTTPQPGGQASPGPVHATVNTSRREHIGRHVGRPEMITNK